MNGTYYSGFKPATFAGWAAAVPDGFVFTLKASRYCTNRNVLAEAGESIARFAVPAFVDLARAAGVAIVHADSAEYPAIADVTGDFVYARLKMRRTSM